MSVLNDKTYNLLQSIHEDIHSDEKTAVHGDIREDPCEKRGETFFGKYFSEETQKFLSYSIIGLSVIAIILYILRNSIANYLFYAEDSGFPSSKVFLTGTIFSIILITYVAYKSNIYLLNNRNWVFWSYIIYCVVLPLWVVNLVLRLEFYVKGQPVMSNGTVFLIIANLSLLVIFVTLGCNNIILSVFTLVSLGWTIYITYQWWFKQVSKSHKNRVIL